MVVALALKVEDDGQPGIATLYGAELDERGDVPVARGEAAFATRGNLALYLPTEVAVRSGRFDLVVHFHGGYKLQEQNVDEAKLRAVVVSVNEGSGGTTPYAKAWAAPNGLDRLIRFAEDEMAKRRLVNARVGRVALSSWSAGGAAVKGILERDGERIDAIILADGLFSNYEEGKKSVRREPLVPFIAFAERAARGEKTFIITHTAIAPTQYPSTAECATALLSALDLGSPGGTTYVVERGGLKVEGSDGTGPEDHVAQIRALDQAYAVLGKRWGD
jgi:hypothetical protein